MYIQAIIIQIHGKNKINIWGITQKMIIFIFKQNKFSFSIHCVFLNCKYKQDNRVCGKDIDITNLGN